MDQKIRLTRVKPGRYEADVRAQGIMGAPMIASIERVPHSTTDCGPMWIVTTDTERWFSSLNEARAYLHRYFIPA